MPLIVPGINSKPGSKGGSLSDQWTNMLMGKKIAETDKSNETTFSKKELPQNHRVVPEDGMMTMDHNPDRLNVHVDKEGIVKKVTHG